MLQLFEDALIQMYERILAYLPTILTAVLLILLGWVLASILRALLARFMASIMSRVAANYRLRNSLDHSRAVETVPRVAGGVIYWLTLILFISAAVERLEFVTIATLLGSFTEYIPNVFLAAVVIFFGVVLGSMARHAIASAAASAGVPSAGSIGRLGQVSVVVISAFVAADQIGIESTFLLLAVGITVGTTLGGVALAFGLGSGPIVANIVASYYVRRTYRLGSNVRIGAVQGRIVEISPTAVAVETADGRVQIPCRRFTEEVSVVLREI